MSEKRGWLREQLEADERDVNKWPAWLRREAGIELEETKSVSPGDSKGKESCDAQAGDIAALKCRFSFRLEGLE